MLIIFSNIDARMLKCREGMEGFFLQIMSIGVNDDAKKFQGGTAFFGLDFIFLFSFFFWGPVFLPSYPLHHPSIFSEKLKKLFWTNAHTPTHSLNSLIRQKWLQKKTKKNDFRKKNNKEISSEKNTALYFCESIL